MNLTDAVENAERLARFKNEDHVVGQIKEGDWQIAHKDDADGQQDMIEPKLIVHADGLDKKYIEEGVVRCQLEFASEF